MTASKTVRSNAETVERFLEGLGGRHAATTRDTAWLWKDVPPGKLLNDLLRDFAVASEGWRLQKPELMEFIRCQAAAGELTNWTVVLVNTDGKVGTYLLAGCEAGKAERKPEDEASWDAGKIPPLYAARNANIQSPSHQALDLKEMPLDETRLVELLAKRTDAFGGPLFNPQEEALLRKGCTEGVTLAQAAERLTALRNPPVEGDAQRVRINGEAARQLRPKAHGLLLIYLVVPTEKRWSATEPPFMGLAFSFPSSHTARSVDYKVNKIWKTTFPDDDHDED